MVCSNCGAPVSADDAVCTACGSAQDRAPMVPVAPIGSPDCGAGASFAALEATTLGRGARHLRVSKPTVIAAVIAVAALVVVGALVVSRSSVAGALRATRSQLATTNGRLTDARSQVGDLQQQVTDLQAARDAGRSRLEDANAATAGRAALARCVPAPLPDRFVLLDEPTSAERAGACYVPAPQLLRGQPSALALPLAMRSMKEGGTMPARQAPPRAPYVVAGAIASALILILRSVTAGGDGALAGSRGMRRRHGRVVLGEGRAARSDRGRVRRRPITRWPGPAPRSRSSRCPRARRPTRWCADGTRATTAHAPTSGRR